RFASGKGDVDLGPLARAGLADDFGRRFVTFAAIGAASTAVSLLLFLVLRTPLGPVPANAIAVTATFLGNTWAHARYTARHRQPRWRRALAVYAGSLAVTSAALALVVAAGGGLAAQFLTLIATWSLATVGRFLVLGARP